MGVATQLDQALKAAAIPFVAVSVGQETDRATWRVEYAAAASTGHRTSGAALLASFDPTSQAAVDADLTTAAAVEARTAVMATCALLSKTLDPTGWAALNQAGKVARVRALADEWKQFYIFAAKAGI